MSADMHLARVPELLAAPVGWPQVVNRRLPLALIASRVGPDGRRAGARGCARTSGVRSPSTSLRRSSTTRASTRSRVPLNSRTRSSRPLTNAGGALRRRGASTRSVGSPGEVEDVPAVLRDAGVQFPPPRVAPAQPTCCRGLLGEARWLPISLRNTRAQKLRNVRQKAACLLPVSRRLHT